jgi:hypothetical protein
VAKPLSNLLSLNNQFRLAIEEECQAITGTLRVFDLLKSSSISGNSEEAEDFWRLSFCISLLD